MINHIKIFGKNQMSDISQKKKQTNQTTYQTHQTLPNFEVKLSQVAHSLILRDRQALNRLHRCHGFLHLEPPWSSMVGSLVVPWSVPVFPRPLHHQGSTAPGAILKKFDGLPFLAFLGIDERGANTVKNMLLPCNKCCGGSMQLREGTSQVPRNGFLPSGLPSCELT